MPDADRINVSDLPRLDRADFWSLRIVEETGESFTVRKDVALPPYACADRGAMATVYADGGYGYAATGDTSPAGLAAALERAAAWARATAKLALFDSRTLPRPAPRGEYASPSLAAPMRSRREWFELLMHESREAGFDPRVVDWEAYLEMRTATHRLVTSTGGDVTQRYRFLLPGISVTAHADGDTQTRSLNGYRGICQQGGDEILDRFGFTGAGRRIAEEALELVAAPNCPSGTMDVLLAPDQMVLQIHESIGHPLELDRILGDERNFAGTSFVTPDMFGTYRYGSDLLNIVFDPTRGEELAAYGWDDDGTKAEKVHLIRNGVLERPLGGAISQARAGLPGTSNARADGWNRPPIDRMANLNLEPGDCSARRHDRGHRARRDDGDEQLVVDRRLAQQVPVRLRARAPDRERQARRRREEPQLPRHHREVLAQSHDGRQRRHHAGAGNAVLRQGRAVAGDSRGARVAGVRVPRCRRVRRRAMIATTRIAAAPQSTRSA